VKTSAGHRSGDTAFDVERARLEARRGTMVEWHGPGAETHERSPFRWSLLLWSLVFPQRRHRIFPTVSGAMLMALSMGIGTAAYNSSNNILFIALSLLLACLILSGVLSWLNFKGVAWRLQLSPPLRVGQEALVGLELRNAKNFLPTYGLWFRLAARAVETREPVKAESTFTARGIDVRAAFAKAEQVEARGQLALRQRLDPQSRTRLEWTLRPTRRGELSVELESVGSLFPFGFLKKQIGTEVRVSTIVWPAPVEYRRFSLSVARRAETGARSSKTGTGGDLLALRRYGSGDSHRLIHWKASARTRQLLVRQFAAEQAEGFSLWVNTDPGIWTRPAQFELLVSFAATLAEDLFRAGRLDAVSLNHEAPVSIWRVRDLEMFLDRLAVLQPLAESVAAPRVGGGTPGIFHSLSLPRKNLLTFKPDGVRGVAAYVGDQRAAAA
jgi:uncharacterized protein (DUF58 family)